jgi:hypothetical protein
MWVHKALLAHKVPRVLRELKETSVLKVHKATKEI